MSLLHLLSLPLLSLVLVQATETGDMVSEVLGRLRVSHVVLLTSSSDPSEGTNPRWPDVVGIERSLWARDILVSVCRLPAHRAHPSTPHARPSLLARKHGPSVRPHSPTSMPEATENRTAADLDEQLDGALVEALLDRALSSVGGTSAVLVFEDSQWVNHLAVVINQRRVLGPNHILALYHAADAHVTPALLAGVRLGAKMVVLQAANTAPAAASASCSLSVRQATLQPSGHYALRMAGCWRGGGRGLELSRPLLPPLTNLHGSHVIVVIVKNFIEAIRVGPGGSHLVGYLGNTITALARTLNFRYHIMDGASFGTKTSNGSFDGVIGHIERKEGDVGLASLSITHTRSQAIDFTAWFRLEPTLFITRGPRFLKDPLAVFKLYTWHVWLTIAAFLFFSALWVWLLWGKGSTSSPHPHSRPHPHTTAAHDPRPPFLRVLAPIFKAIVYQGSATGYLPRNTGARTVYLTAWLVVVVLMSMYSGNLTAFLSLPVLNRPPTTIHELVTRDWTIQLNKAYGSHDLIKNTLTTDYQILYRRALERNTIVENRGATHVTGNAVAKLQHSKLAITMGEPGAFYNLNSNRDKDGSCLLTYGQEALGHEYTALAVTKKSLLRPILDSKLRWMRQMGVTGKYYNNFFGVKCYRGKVTSSETTPLILTQLLGVFYMWVGGMVLACLVLLGELYHHSLTTRSN